MSTAPAGGSSAPEPRSQAGSVPQWVARFTITAAIAWVGFFVHNVADLPDQTILSPESLIPTLITLVALALWFIPGTRAIGGWTLLLWAVLNLVGGAVSVLPLPILPFVPEQSVAHYTFHLVYAIAQVPLIVVATVWLRRRGVPAPSQ